MDNDVKLFIKWFVAAIIIIFVVCFIFGGFHIVPPGHRGVCVTLGKVDLANIRGEGFTTKIPFISKINDIPIRQITTQSVAQTFSSDLQTVKITYNILYRLPEHCVAQLFQQYSGDPYITLVEPRVQETIKQVASAYRAEDIVKNREKVKHATLEKLRMALGTTVEQIEANAGKELVIINDLVVSNIDLTDELEKAIENKQVMEQSALAKNYELQREQKEAEITIVRAKAEAESVRIKGEALKQSPDVIQLEIVKKWDGKTPGVVSTMAGGANILLPLK